MTCDVWVAVCEMGFLQYERMTSQKDGIAHLIADLLAHLFAFLLHLPVLLLTTLFRLASRLCDLGILFPFRCVLRLVLLVIIAESTCQQ